MPIKVADSLVTATFSCDQELTSFQLSTSQLLQSICAQATDKYTLLGMMTGGIFASFAKAHCSTFLSSFSLFQKNPFGQFAVRGFSAGAACAAEATGFHSVPEWLRGAPTTESKFEEGMSGWTHTFLTIALLKGTGGLLPADNVVIQHLSQDALMVGLDHGCAWFGLTTATQGTFFEQMMSSELVNIQMAMGGCLTRNVAPGVALLEMRYQVRVEVAKRSGRGSSHLQGGEVFATNEGFTVHASQLESSEAVSINGATSRLIGGANLMARTFDGESFKERKYLVNPANPSEKFGYVFVLNRAEPAMRAIRATEELGLIPIVAVSGPDAASLHATWPTAEAIPIGGELMKDSYGNAEQIRLALREIKRRQDAGLLEKTGVIVDPMWGGLAEDPILPRIIEEEGERLGMLVRFAGPNDAAMNMFGPKTEANKIMAEAGFTLIPSSKELSGTRKDFTEAVVEWRRLSNDGEIPTVAKAVDGGGGRGFRKIPGGLGLERGLIEFERFYFEAADEAERVFGSRRILIQEEIVDANHYELQCIADAHGNVRVVGVRFCSLQRNKQKLEEIDCTALFGREVLDQFFVPIVERAMGIARSRDPRGVGYTGAFTIECLANLRGVKDRKPWEFDLTKLLFMEVNARLQVEHAVTEQANKVRTEDGLVALDLEREKIRIAAGFPISFRQDQIVSTSFAIEARLNAEDPFAFTPSPGLITHLEVPDYPWFRFDRGFKAGYSVPSQYDSLIGKAIVDKEVPALPTTSGEKEKIWRAGYARLNEAMRGMGVAGIRTNKELHSALATDERVLGGNFNNQYVEEVFLSSVQRQTSLPHWDVALLATTVATYRKRQRTAIEGLNPQTEFRSASAIEVKIGGHSFTAQVSEAPQRNYYWVKAGENRVLVGHHETGAAHSLTLQGRNYPPVIIHSEQGKRVVTIAGVEHELEVGGEGTLGEDHIVAPIPGKVVKISVKPGDRVKEGQELVVVEAMKMENAVTAPKAGRVLAITTRKGELVTPTDSLGCLEFSEGEAGASATAGTGSTLPESRYLVTDPLVSTLLTQAPRDQVGSPPNLQTVRELCRRAILGFDVPTDLLQGAIGFLPTMAMGSSEGREAVLGTLRELFDTLSSVQLLFHPRYEGEFKALLSRREQGGAATSKEYAELLTGKENDDGSRTEGVLKLYGVNSLNRSYELHEALYRLGMAHGRLSEIRTNIQFLIELAHALQAVELVPSLRRVRHSVVEQIDSGSSIGTYAEEIARALEAKDPVQETGAKLFEKWFTQASTDPDPARREEAGEEILASLYALDRYLIERIGSKDSRIRELATELLFKRLYGYEKIQIQGRKPKHVVETFEPLAVTTTSLGTFRENGNGRIRSVGWGVARSGVDIARAVSHARATLEARRKESDKKTDDVIEVILPIASQEIPDARVLDEVVKQAMDGAQGFKRVTVIFAHQSSKGLEPPFFRTFRPDGPQGEFIRDPLYDDIHPIDAWRIELDRWDPNFVLQRVPFHMFPGIHAFRAQDRTSYETGLAQAMKAPQGEKGSGADWRANITGVYERFRKRLQTSPSFPVLRVLGNLLPHLNGGDPQAHEMVQANIDEAGKKGDRRNILIAEVADVTPVRFKSDLLRRLELILDKLNQDPKAQLTEEESIAWRAVPWGLKATGLLSSEANIFTIRTMMEDPHHLIALFKLTKARVNRAGEALIGEVCSLPEAEQQAMNTAAAFNHIQHDRVLSPKGSLHGRADLFIWSPLDGIPNDALRYLIARSTQPFTHQLIDKTIVHFIRDGKEEIAVVRISEHQLEIKIEEVTDRAPHRVFSEAQKIRMAREIAGSPHPYDRVELYRTSIANFWPNGQAPKDAVRIQEMILGEDGKFYDYQPVPGSEGEKRLKANPYSVKREPGENKEGKIVFRVDIKCAANPEGTEFLTRTFVELNDDYGIKAGSLGEGEADIHEAACEYAIEHGFDFRYISEQAAGARIGFPKEVYRASRKNKDIVGRYGPEGKHVYWATEAELNSRVIDPDTGKEVEFLKELVEVGEEVEFDGVKGYRFTAVYGSDQVKNPFTNTDSLRGSQRTARAMDRVTKAVGVMTTVPRRKGTASTVGIGVYNWVKGLLTQIVKGAKPAEEATAPLTGPDPVNENLGTHYSSPRDYAGARRLLEAGVALLGPEHDLESSDQFLRWLSYLPIGKEKRPAIIKTGDSPDRPIEKELMALIPNETTPYDVRDYIHLRYDQGFQGGFFEIGKGHGNSVVLGLARDGNEPVFVIAAQPKPDPVSAESGQGPFYGGTLDAESASKFWRGVQLANLWGLPIRLVDNFKGYGPADWDVSDGVYLEGERINQQLVNSDQPILAETPRKGSTWGGVDATNGAGVNPEKIIVGVARSGRRGILGPVGAIKVPAGGERELDILVNIHPEIRRLDERIRTADAASRNRLIDERSQLARSLREEELGPALIDFVDLGNSPARALRRGTIQHVFEDGETRRAMIDVGHAQIADYRREQIEAAAAREADVIVTGWLNSIRGVPAQITEPGRVQFELAGAIYAGGSTVIRAALEAQRGNEEYLKPRAVRRTLQRLIESGQVNLLRRTG